VSRCTVHNKSLWSIIAVCYWNKWSVLSNEVVVKVSCLIHKVDSPHTGNQGHSLLSFFSFQFDIDNKLSIGTVHVQFYTGVDMTYIFFINHNSYVKSSTYLQQSETEDISGKFSVVIVSNVEVRHVKLCNYLLIVSARTIVWIWILHMKEGRHYSIFEEVILLALLSVLFLYVLTIVKMKFKFYFLVVIFHWTEYTKKVQTKMNIFPCTNSCIREIYFGHNCICSVTLLWLISVISILQCYFELHSVVSSRSGNSVRTSPHSDEQGECLKFLVTFCNICICHSFMHP
jgi:hypothetical protein